MSLQRTPSTVKFLIHDDATNSFVATPYEFGAHGISDITTRPQRALWSGLHGDSLPTNEMVAIPMTNGVKPQTNGKRGTPLGTNDPYAPRAANLLSKISNFNTIESTLRGTFPSDHSVERRRDVYSDGNAGGILPLEI
ncbi:hypothetical protein FPV67DRAFT_1674221 [Lyophyllum atratum]|nr:hypothetical protein FPV67DRAFT_1674221 [Lyophyllum atratum]